MLEIPPAVAKPLRKALKYEKYSKNPKLAADYYQQTLWAINDCERSMGLDPFTPPILHLKMHIGLFLWDVLHYQLSIDFLEQIKRDCGRWLREYSILPGKKLQRTEVILFTVRLSVKIAELCVDDHMLELDKAEEHLVYAIETVMKESKRREEEGVTEVKEGPWLSDDEFGATLERLGHFYEAKDDHYLAAPLFLQAITKLNAKSCHMAVLMNNLSICLAQQVVPVAKGEKPVPRSTLVSNARAWSQKALEVAAKIQPPERDEECDLSCVVATHNLGEFAEMDGNIAEARKRYEEALSLARAIKFKEGITTADEALKRVYTKNMVTVTKT